MFRAEIRLLADGLTLKVEGRLVGDWAEQARSLVTKDVVPLGLIVDLSDVSYVDSAGKKLLKWLATVGAQFVAGSVYALSVCAFTASPEYTCTPTAVWNHGREQLRYVFACDRA
jgi:hypothetical protein